MTTETQIRQALGNVLVPGVQRSIVGLNMVRGITISEGKVSVNLASTGLVPGAQDWIKDRTRDAIEKLPDVKEVSFEYSQAKAKDLNKIGQMIAVMSGKGGVGKSLVSSMIAIALKRQGYEVGILDADITGPSIPRIFGVKGPIGGNDDGLLPVLTKSGIEVMSINLLLPDENEAVIWRGPLIGNIIKQFGEDVLWGNLDYLIIDLPPGTADAPLTVLQSLPVSGIIVVFTPQDLVDMIVKKAVNMAQKMEKRIIGVVENMSYLYVPEINKKIEIFGKSRGEQMAKAAGAPLLGQLPIDPQVAKLCDEGNIESYTSKVFDEFSQKLAGIIKAEH
ncbi:MAG TPA: Mrp/NBP35 family ATP-binding protein [Dehalococcoidales bacterium]|nr:Mrp/NBP35 family ATP-binding protein [Dehalococcoidales bacterium]